MSVERTSFARGWCPDCDPIGAPADALLRMDNCVLDELGMVTLRQGSAIVYSGLGADVHSLFTRVINGTRHRFAGIDNKVYDNGVALVTGIAGSADVAFGASRGQVLMARSTTKKKFDGTTVRNWGIAQTGAAPTVATVAPDSKQFASGDIAEAPAFTCPEGVGPAYITGQDGTANGAVVLVPDPVTNRGTLQKVYAAETDFTAYSGGTIGTDADLITLYVYIDQPERLLAIDLMIDVNASSTNRFQDDYYAGSFQRGVDADLTPTDPLQGNFTARGPTRHRLPTQGVVVGRAVSRVRTDKPVANAGWSKLAIRRGQMLRVGSTAGKDWKTVKAIQLVVTVTSPVAIFFDDIKIVSAGQLGPYKWAYVLAYNSGSYVGLSAPSPLSVETPIQTQSVTLTAPADAGRDPQVNEIWFYRMGGPLDDFYRVKVAAVSGTGVITGVDALSDSDALTANIHMESDNTVPPNNILGIVGPYFDRILALTATGIFPSRRLNIDSFATGQVITVGASDETALWIARGLGGIYVGTTRDIYRLEGTGVELPDGSIEFNFQPLNLAHPPVSDAVTKDGNSLYYLSADGWRGVAGAGSALIVGQTSLLYRGYTRHGVGPVNVTGGRFRTTIAKGQLLAITPEGTGIALSSGVIYRHAPAVNSWYRHAWDRDWRSLYTEPDGTVLAGDNGGRVWQLDVGTSDNGVSINAAIWTPQYNEGSSFARKDPLDVRLFLDTGGSSAPARFYFDGSATAAKTVTCANVAMGIVAASMDGLSAYRDVQCKFTGDFFALRFGGFALNSTPLPVPFVGTIRSTDASDSRVKTFSGFQIRLCTVGVARSITPLLDGVAQTALSVTTGVNEPRDVTYMFPAPLTGVDFALLVDGDVELYRWTPLVTTMRPLGVLSWDSGPLDLKTNERVWLRRLRVQAVAGGDIVATPYFDGVAWPSVTLPVSVPINVPTILDVFVGRAYVGQVPRLVLTSDAPFYPYWVECVRRSTGAVTDKTAVRIPAQVGVGA